MYGLLSDSSGALRGSVAHKGGKPAPVRGPLQGPLFVRVAWLLVFEFDGSPWHTTPLVFKRGANHDGF